MITDLKNCTGCRLCEQKCNKNAISMQSNAEGFLYPSISTQLCNQCGQCKKICPMFKSDLQNDVLEVFAAKSLNREQLLKSASGGIFAALAENILERNGVVFGCAYDENLVAKHIGIENSSEIYKLQSSKYVQSDTLNTYTRARDFLEQNRQVLYSGTPCQIAGLRAFLAKDYENLVTVDLICYGVPSPGLFAKYIEWLSKKMDGKIIGYNFRSKERNGWGYEIEIKTKTKTKYTKETLDPYYSGFAKGKTFRECCYFCKYACGKRTGDITLGDYWGVKQVHPEFFSRDGVSVVLVNTQNGKISWKNACNKIESIQSSFEKCSKFQGMLNRPAKRPVSRDSFTIHTYSFSKILFYLRLVNTIPYKMRQRIKEISIFRRKNEC